MHEYARKQIPLATAAHAATYACHEVTSEAVIEFCRNLGHYVTVVSEVPEVRIVRDPNDDMIVACAIAAGADYLVTRDKDILSLDRYESIRFVTPEVLLKILRERKDGTGAPGDTGNH